MGTVRRERRTRIREILKKSDLWSISELVGARGFEPPTPRSRTECSTRLSHAPTGRTCYLTSDPTVNATVALRRRPRQAVAHRHLELVLARRKRLQRHGLHRERLRFPRARAAADPRREKCCGSVRLNSGACRRRRERSCSRRSDRHRARRSSHLKDDRQRIAVVNDGAATGTISLRPNAYGCSTLLLRPRAAPSAACTSFARIRLLIAS